MNWTVPDPSKPLIMEVDSSETGFRAILSQRFGEKLKVHPVAFLSRKLFPTEHNYDISNRELFAVKPALEQSHWLHH